MKRSLTLLFFLFLFSFSLEASYQDELLEQLLLAEEGDVIEIPEGFHEITVSLSLEVSDVTIRGKGKHKSILSFKKQRSGAEGLKVSAQNIILEDFAILDAVGDGIKVSHSRNLIIRNVKVGWTEEVSEKNGGYGFYPVMSENILLEDCEAFGASDAGIYVGQSKNIIVRNNYAYKNVAGIEIENSIHADVYGNVSERNTGGILIFSLPNLSQYGSKVRVFNNIIYDNNLRNFAAPSNIVGYVPQGTGLMVMAYDLVEVFDNRIAGNDTLNVLLTSYNMTEKPINDPKYQSFVSSVYLYNNHLSLGGRDPKGGSSSQSINQVLALKGILNSKFPDILYDGFAESEDQKNLQKICFSPNHTGSFVYLDYERSLENWSRKRDPYYCSLKKLAPVVLPEWFHRN